jgi:hypothetical protein
MPNVSRRKLLILFSILLSIIIGAGWFATDHLGNKARQEIIGEGRSSALSLYIYVSSTLTNIEGAVKSPGRISLDRSRTDV